MTFVRSLLRWAAVVLLLAAALMISVWPVNRLAWSVPQSGQALHRILCVDEKRCQLVTVHTQSINNNPQETESQLRQYDLETGRYQSCPLPKDDSALMRTQVWMSEDRSQYALWSSSKSEIDIYCVGEDSARLRIKPTATNSGGAVSAGFSPDGSLLAALFSEDINVWNVTSGELVCRFLSPPRTQNDNYQGSTAAHAISMTSDNLLLAVGGQGKGIAVYNLQKKYLVGQIPRFGIPRFVSTTRLAVLPRRGEKTQVSYYALGAESVTTEGQVVPLPAGEVAVSNNSDCYFTVDDNTGQPSLRASLPSWVPTWFQQKWVDWFAKSFIRVNLRGYDILTGQVISEQTVPIVAYTHQFLVMPSTANQLLVSDDSRFIANDDTQTICLWDQKRTWGIWRWLGAGLLASSGTWLIFRPRWPRGEVDGTTKAIPS